MAEVEIPNRAQYPTEQAARPAPSTEIKATVFREREAMERERAKKDEMDRSRPY